MPGWTVGDQGIPAFRAPAFGNSIALKDEVRHTAFAQMVAHGQTGLAATHDEDFDLLNRHL